jgi:hypothetical protein
LRVSVQKLSIGIALAAAALVLIARAHRRGSDVKLIDQRQGRELWTLVRQMEARGLEAPEREGDAAHLVREPLDEARAQDFFPIAGDCVYDPHMYFKKRGGLSIQMTLLDYPGGAWTLHTNSSGLREDADLPAQRPDLFVLVAGDSHTEGMCSNSESYANRLEAALARNHPKKSVEVLNTGCASYTFYNYLGALEAYADLRPEVFVTAVFGGNDFVECLPLYNYFHRTQQAAVNRDEWTRVSSMLEMGESTLAQGLSSASYFSRFPDQVDNALRAALEVSDEIRRRCAEMGTTWIVVYIPSVFDLPDSEAAAQRAKAQEVMKLSDQDMQTGNRLGDRFVRALRERGVEVIDMRDHFTAEGRPWYWAEYHINLKSQAKIAELLLPRVEASIVSSAGAR